MEAINSLNELLKDLNKGHNKSLFSSLDQSIIPLIVNRIKTGGKIYTAGNGGSHATAMHLSEELIGKYEKIRRPIGAVCLSSDSGAITCIGNDFGYNNVFSRQVEALCTAKDVLILFTTSGNSLNIIEAAKAAFLKKCLIIVFNGGNGGELGKLKNYFLYQITPQGSNSARIQEIHEIMMHSIAKSLDSIFAEV